MTRFQSSRQRMHLTCRGSPVPKSGKHCSSLRSCCSLLRILFCVSTAFGTAKATPNWGKQLQVRCLSASAVLFYDCVFRHETAAGCFVAEYPNLPIDLCSPYYLSSEKHSMLSAGLFRFSSFIVVSWLPVFVLGRLLVLTQAMHCVRHSHSQAVRETRLV